VVERTREYERAISLESTRAIERARARERTITLERVNEAESTNELERATYETTFPRQRIFRRLPRDLPPMPMHDDATTPFRCAGSPASMGLVL
jgi:hypothetical protein